MPLRRWLPRKTKNRYTLVFFSYGAYQDQISGYGGIKHCLIPSPKHIIVGYDKNGKLVDWVYAKRTNCSKYAQNTWVSVAKFFCFRLMFFMATPVASHSYCVRIAIQHFNCSTIYAPNYHSSLFLINGYVILSI